METITCIKIEGSEVTLKISNSTEKAYYTLKPGERLERLMPSDYARVEGEAKSIMEKMRNAP